MRDTLCVTGLALVCFALMIIGVRVAVTGHWLPAGLGVLWFTLGELVVLPWGLLLVLLGYGLTRRTLGTDRKNGTAKWQRLGAVALIVLTFTAIASLDRYVLYPVLSRKLNWGMYGLGPPVRLAQLAEVTRIADVSLPRHARLIDGEYQGGMDPYLIAKIAVPRDEVTPFIHQPLFMGKAESEAKAFYNQTAPRMVSRGWDVDSVQHFISVRWTPVCPQTEKQVSVVIDMDRPDCAVVYVYWMIL